MREVRYARVMRGARRHAQVVTRVMLPCALQRAALILYSVMMQARRDEHTRISERGASCDAANIPRCRSSRGALRRVARMPIAAADCLRYYGRHMPRLRMIFTPSACCCAIAAVCLRWQSVASAQRAVERRAQHL